MAIPTPRLRFWRGISRSSRGHRTADCRRSRPRATCSNNLQGGELKDRDTDDSYTRLHQLVSSQRKFVVLLLDQSDVHCVPKGRRVVSWQVIAEIQLSEFRSLELPAAAKTHLLSLLRDHLSWYGIAGKESGTDISLFEPLCSSRSANVEPRMASLIRGAEIVVRARRRMPVIVPTGFEREYGLEDFSRLAKEGHAVLKDKSNWQALCW